MLGCQVWCTHLEIVQAGQLPEGAKVGFEPAPKARTLERTEQPSERSILLHTDCLCWNNVSEPRSSFRDFILKKGTGRYSLCFRYFERSGEDNLYDRSCTMETLAV